ncbi:hypothetical protein THTE_2624 [Thermogutta terrifontis]|uniref:Uncharacterized protein n=1 Tax=Thermogutta terrifontis TaxID=1331910 RepID=A0A286RH17_9BACT|nr:hypothetical protein THTE_2624 [Thermogutta terrifontis]
MDHHFATVHTLKPLPIYHGRPSLTSVQISPKDVSTEPIELL